MPRLQWALVLFARTMSMSAPLAAGNVAVAAPEASDRAMMLALGDGDTRRGQAGGRSLTIRLACIDAPETAQFP